MIRGLNRRRSFAGLGLISLAGGGLFIKPAQGLAGETSRCTCSDGRKMAVGAVGYSRKSFREAITRIEADGTSPESRCRAIWIGSTEIRPRGTPYNFYLERRALEERRIDRCGYLTDHFMDPSKTYQFLFDADSISIRELRLSDPKTNQPAGPDSEAKSNTNLWNSITPESTADIRSPRKRTLDRAPAQQLSRTSWVMARKALKAHFVGLVREIDQSERLVPLKRTGKVRAGQLGQIEAVNAGRAIVRFYQGSGTVKFGRPANALRRWYDNVGGPYAATNDDLYTPIGAYILEVSVDDIIEVNDYLDRARTDRTWSSAL